MKKLIVLIAVSVLLLSSHGWGESSLEDSRLTSELSLLTSAIDKLASQLKIEQQRREDDVMFRKLDLAIAYLNFRSRRIESLERDISNQRSIRSRLEENLPLLAERLNEIELRMQEYPQGPPAELAEAYDDLKTQQTIFSERISRIDDTLVMKENLMYELQNQIRDVEEYVQRHLDM